MPHVSIKGETIFEILHFPVTNSLITSIIVTALFAFLAVYYKNQASKSGERSSVFYVLNGMLKAIYGLYTSVLGGKVNLFFPLLASYFFFILLNNWFGLVPGVGSLLIEVVDQGKNYRIPLFRAATADLNTTLALALSTVFLTQVFGFSHLGALSHLKKYASPIGILEAFSEMARVLSFSFRLFGNIFAGEVVLVIVAFLMPLLTSPFFLLEIFVGLVQAVVFSTLSAVFINSAIAKHH